MKCSSCSKENTPKAKFCKYCGAELALDYKTCANGHNFDSSLAECPYCPRAEVSATITKAITSAKTVINNKREASTSLNDQTQPATTQTKTVIDEKTVLLSSDKKDKTKSQADTNRLIGWLVSYDLDPTGKDFKIFDGRTKIGRSNTNNIVIDKQEISDDHVLLLCRDNKVIIQDQLSANGTFVNGKKVDERIQVKDNDTIKLGSISFKLKII